MSSIYSEPMTENEARQRLAELKVLVAAYEQGYYNTPRENTLQKLATELDMNEEAVSEYLFRRQDNLLNSISKNRNLAS